MSAALSRNALKTYLRLAAKKHRAMSGKFLAEGIRLCEEALNADWPIESLIYAKALLESPRPKSLFELAELRNIPVYEVEQKVFEKLAQTDRPQGLLAIVHQRKPDGDPFDIIRLAPRCLWVAIDRLHDPGNLGSIMRTAEWLGVDGLLIGDDCVECFNPKVVRASMGSIFHLPLYEVPVLPDLLRRLQQFGCVTYAADQAGDFPYTTLSYASKKILLLGDEIDGLSDDLLDVTNHRVAIPRKGHGESLNVAVAAAILLAEMVR